MRDPHQPPPRPIPTGERAPGAEDGAGPEAGRPREDAASPAPRSLEEAIEWIARLEAEVAEQNSAALTLRDQYLRERAELENFKRRLQKDKAEALRYATEPVLRDLLGVIDNLERALKAGREAANREGGAPSGPLAALLTGVEMVVAQFSDVLGRHGVARVPSRNEAFDPAHHEALAQVESHEHPAGTIVEEHTAGYRLHDRLLRAAQVTVTRPPAPGTTTPRRN